MAKMKRYLTAAAALFVFLSFTDARGRGYLNFIYCSDVHYGLEREFRGGVVSADSVSRAMIEAFRILEDTPLPDDGGVADGNVYGSPDFVICTGDIANRMEDGVQPASVSWSMFCRDWSGYCIIGDGPDSGHDRVPLYLVPGNHDISDAIGYTEPLTPERDASSAAGIWNHNMAETPSDTIPADRFDYSMHKTHYTFVKDSIRFAFMGMWPDSIWNGVDGSISLPVFRVDSPMKGEYSSEDETLLSFIAVSIDPESRRLTARECLWNSGQAPGVSWGATKTIGL